MKALFQIKPKDLNHPTVQKILPNYALVVCHIATDPAKVREFTDAKLLVYESGIGVVTTAPKAYLAKFGEEMFFRAADRSRAKSTDWGQDFHLPLFEVANRKLEWFGGQLVDAFDGLYLDLSGRGYSPSLIVQGLPIERDDLWLWHDRQASYIDYFAKQFRRLFSNHLSLFNSWGPKDVRRLMGNAGIHNPLYPREVQEATTGVTIERGGIRDLPYFQRVAENARGNGLGVWSVDWYGTMSLEDVVMPGEFKWPAVRRYEKGKGGGG